MIAPVQLKYDIDAFIAGLDSLEDFTIEDEIQSHKQKFLEREKEYEAKS